MAGSTAGAGRSVTSKVTAILMAFSRGDAYSLTELARLTGLPVSTAHRLAGELAARRLLERTPDGGYRIGLPLRMIGAGAGAEAAEPPTSPAAVSLLAAAAGVTSDLADATRSPVRLGTLDGRAVLEALVRPGEPAPRALAASGRPVTASALGRVLLAFGPPAVATAVLGGTAGTARLRRALRTTRLTRVAVSRATNGSGAVAMPVFGAGGVLLGALELEVADPAGGLHGARAALAVATGSLTRQLATTDPPAPQAPGRRRDDHAS